MKLVWKGTRDQAYHEHFIEGTFPSENVCFQSCINIMHKRVEEEGINKIFSVYLTGDKTLIS